MYDGVQMDKPNESPHQCSSGAGLGVAGDGEAGDPDEDGWDTGGAVWPGDVGTDSVAGALTTGGVAGVRNLELLGGSGKSQGRGTNAAGIILQKRV